MRVLYFSDNHSAHNRRFLEALAASGHETWFLNCSVGQALPADWLPRGVGHLKLIQDPAREAGPGSFTELVPQFRDLVKNLHPDLVHAGPILSAGFIAALSEFHPLLIMSWGSDLLVEADRDSASQRATEVTLQAADGFFCDCHAVRHAARRFASLDDSRIAQFPWGLKRGVFAPKGRLYTSEKFRTEPNTIYFIATRSWEPLYGTDVLLKAFDLARAQDPRLRLLLLGAGSQADSVRDFISSRRLGDVVLTPGVVGSDELPQWFRVAQGYVSCAYSDGTSISMLEAMATGLPVVVTDIPSNREWVTTGENGWLAGMGSSQEFADKLLRVASLGVQEREQISERNQEIVAQRADWDRNFPRLLELYDRLAIRSAKTVIGLC